MKDRHLLYPTRTVIAAAMLSILSAPSVAEAQEQLSIELGFSEILRLGQPISDVIVGNPLVAGVSLAREGELIVNASGIGATNLIALDERGKEVAHYRVTVVPVATPPSAPFSDAKFEIAPEYTVTVVSGISSIQTFICDGIRGCDPRARGDDPGVNEVGNAAPPSTPAATTGTQALPNYDIEAQCRQVSAAGGAPSNVLYNTCVEQEQTAYNALRQSWGRIPQQIRNSCDQVTAVGGNGSYNILQTCIQQEMEAGATPQTFRR